MNMHNLKKKIKAIFGKKKKVTVNITKDELHKAFSSEKNFSELLDDIYLAIETQILQDLYQEHRKNIDKNIRKVGVKIAKNKIYK